MTEPQEYPLGAVLTLAAGSNDRLFCSLTDLYAILGWMLADHPMADQVDDYIAAARPAVLEQHPDLADVKPPRRGSSDTTVLKWLADLEAIHGATLPLVPLKAAQR